MEKRVPESILYRKDKKGFQAPNSWMKDERVRNLINASANVVRETGIIDKPIDSNNWRYIMAAKTISNE